MRKLTRIALSLAMVAAGLVAFYYRGELERFVEGRKILARNQLPNSFYEALLTAPEVTVAALASFDGDPLGRVPISRLEDRRCLQKALVHDTCVNVDEAAICFYPRHRVVIHDGELVWTLDLCYDCGWALAEAGDWQKWYLLRGDGAEFTALLAREYIPLDWPR